jgi:two-component system, chemotaxis family, CheB/CheR fusion protein
VPDTPDAAFEALLDFLKRSRGFDFTGYKRPSLERRFRRRMEAVGCKSYGDYLDFLEVHPDEFGQLFDTLLINVTEFFRDPPVWQHLRASALPELLDAKAPDDPIRVWSAGCASGEEAYTAAIVLAELMGHDAYRERVKIYATDVDEDALTTARQAIYPPKRLEGLEPELRERYFERVGSQHAFRKDLRRTVIFGRNNLVVDAPISRIDLLICRNTLMYFTAETQAHILRHFHFALADRGVMVLGKSEMMLSHRGAFIQVDLKKRIFRKNERAATLQGRLAALPDAVGNGGADVLLPEEERVSRDAALELGPDPMLLVSRGGVLTFANLPARALFRIAVDDLGQPLAERKVATDPVELRPAIEQAMLERRAVMLGEVAYSPDTGEQRRLEVTVSPLMPNGGKPIGASVVFEDVSRISALRRELESNRRDLELAYEELQSTIDELETTNEELQSANEELQTTNEELQSTNEELETMNEELQSTNEELETINDELRERTGELNEVNDFLEAILSSLGVAVSVIDRDQRVQVWNRHAEDLWGVRLDEALDQHLQALDIGLPTEQLAQPLREVLSGRSPSQRLELDAVNRRGRAISCTVTIMPLVKSDGDGKAPRGGIILMEDGRPPEREGDGDGAGP